jgi:hypothetical protein
MAPRNDRVHGLKSLSVNVAARLTFPWCATKPMPMWQEAGSFAIDLHLHISFSETEAQCVSAIGMSDQIARAQA